MKRIILSLLALSSITASVTIDAGKKKQPIVSQDSYYRKGHASITELFNSHFTSSYTEKTSEQLTNELTELVQDVRTYPANSKTGHIAFNNLKSYCKGAADALRAVNLREYHRAKEINHTKDNEQFIDTINKIVIKAFDIAVQASNLDALTKSLPAFLKRDCLQFIRNVKSPSPVKESSLIPSAADKQIEAYHAGKAAGTEILNSIATAMETGTKLELTNDSIKNSTFGKRYLQVSNKIYSSSPKSAEHKAAFKELKLLLLGFKDGLPFSSIKPHFERMSQINPFMGPIALKTYMIVMQGIDYVIAADDINNGVCDCFRFWLSELNPFITKYQALLGL